MIDWSKIDNDKIFQRLISHLVALECHTPGFLPSSPYIGADGGYDVYVDNYAEENLSGDICGQAKFTKHSLKQAYEYLRGEVQRELDKADKNKIDHLIISTNAELNVNYIKKLSALNKYNNISLWIWDREKLTIKIEKQPFLRSYFFNSPAIPLFVPPSIYFEEVEAGLNLSEEFLKGIKTVEKKFEEIALFLKNDNARIFILHAPGGYGKSHFLREFPVRARSTGINREVWFIRDGIRDIRDAFNDEIGVRETTKEGRKYIFVLDDADRADDVKDILHCITKSGINAKLVIALRTAGIFALEEILISAKCKDLAIVTSIPQWSDDEFKMLLRALAQKDKIIDEDDIIRRFPNPFFIVRIGLNIRGKSTYDFQSTKKAILQSLQNDTRQVMISENTDVIDLLLNLTLITPINIKDHQTIAKLAQKLNVDDQRMKSILAKLIKGGVLRSIGNILRFIPDMMGDVFLLEAMQSLKEDARKEVFLYWFDTHSKNILCNLGATLRYGDKSCLEPIVAEVISGWINNSGRYDTYKRRQVLENIEDICNIAPDKTINLLWTFLYDPDLSTDAYGPIVVRLIHSDMDRKEIVKIIEGLREKAKRGSFSNYEPNTLVRETVTPLRNNMEKQIMPILFIIEQSLKSSEPIVEFAKAALREVLASAHKWSRSTYDSMTIGNRALRVTDSVLAMRNKALEIIKAMLLDKRPALRLAAIEIVVDIGECPFGPEIPAIPLDDKIIKERQEMIEFIDHNNLVGKEIDRSVLSSYEDLLFGWWAHQYVPDKKILPLLDKINNEAEYRIYRYYTSRWDISEDIREKLKSAPSKDRWPWVVDNILQTKWNLTIEDFEKDAICLNQKYPTSQKIVDFLHELDKTVTTDSTNVLFLRAWFKQNPDIFRQIWFDKKLWNNIPLVFRHTISYELAQKSPEMAKIIIDGALFSLETPIDELKIAIGILSYDMPAIDKYGIIKLIAEKDIDVLNLIIIERMQFIGDKISAKEMAEIVQVILNHLSSQARAKSTDHIVFILHNRDKDYIREFLDITQGTIYSILLSSGKLDYHDFTLAALMFTNVKKLVDFIEARFEQEKSINRHSEYEAIPYKGIEFIEKVIKDSKDYLHVLEKVLDWDEEYGGITSLSISVIFKQIVSLEDGSGKLYLDGIKDKFYRRDRFLKYLSCLFQLPLNHSNIAIFDEALKKSKEFQYENEMIRLLKSKIYPEDGWSSSVGEIPSAFIEKRDVFRILKNNAPMGFLKNALDECLIGTNRMIEDHQKEEENRFHSR